MYNYVKFTCNMDFLHLPGRNEGLVAFFGVFGAGQNQIPALKELAKERDDLNQTSPQTFKWAYKRAKAAIEAGEAYAVDQCDPQ